MAAEPSPPDADKKTGGVTIGNIIGGIHNSIIAGRDVVVQVFIQVFRGTVSDEIRALRNRQAMLKLVKDFWVKGVLENSLHGAVLIELGLEERQDAVERPWDMVLQIPNQPNRVLPPDTRIVDVFDEIGQSLLILGNPGSGKTTILLELARQTIARAETDPTQRIPVIFNLSSWAEWRQPLTTWLVEELNSKYQIPKEIGKSWVNNDELMLLLDGLDEVTDKLRDDCVKAINDFHQSHFIPLVVCSRIADYDTLSTRLKLDNAIFITPLTPQQINDYLNDERLNLVAVRQTLQHDTHLQELANSPLMLSIMALAYRGMSRQELLPLSSVEARRKHLFDTYIRRMFKRRGGNPRYEPEQTIHWLTWLAQRMSQHSQAVFLLESLQISWLDTHTQLWLYSVYVGLIVWLIFGLSFGLIVGLFGVLISGLSFALIIGLIVWLFFGLFGLSFGLRNMRKNGRLVEITPVEKLNWSWKRGEEEARVWGVIRALVSGVSGGLVGGLIFGLVGELSGIRLIGVLIFGLIFMLIVGGRPGVNVETRTIPNQGIWRSLQTAVFMTLSIGITAGMSVGLIGGLSVGPLAGLFFGLLAGLTDYGGETFVKHFSLRFVLYHYDHIPWNYIGFLDYAAERIFLRKVGGGYIFIHRLLMEHFAELESER